MTALALDVRELTGMEIDMVSGAGWFSDLISAVQHFAGQVMQMVVDAATWLAENGFYYEDKDGGFEVGFR